MSDKRRKARVQGGWAPKRTKAISSTQTSTKSTISGTKEMQAQSSASHHLTFKPTIKESRKKAGTRVFDSDGEFEISESLHGLSKVRLIHNFIEPEETDWMFEQLKSEVPWQEKEIVVWGKKCMQPRLTAWFGDFPYTYSRLTLQPYKWSPLLNILREKIKAETGFEFNSMLANLYRDNKDSVDWHSDDEKSLGQNPIIASLSFGDTRVFELKRKPLKDDQETDDNSPNIKIPLKDGSLLLMSGATQHDWENLKECACENRERNHVNSQFIMKSRILFYEGKYS